MIALRGGRILASGLLADALSDQLASTQSAADPVRIGVSFRSKSGEYCRSFAVREPTALAGLACRAADGWQVGVLTPAPSPMEGPGPYRQAASSMPPAVIAAIGDRIASEPLDARGEAAARGRRWRQ